MGEGDRTNGPAITGATVTEITASILAGLKAGALRPGDPLPTVRDLASRLSVNRNTVATAYKRLTERGIVATSGRRGSRILPVDRPAPPDPSGGGGVVNLANGNPDPALLPKLNATLRQITFAHRNYEDPDVPELMALGAAAFAADGLPVGGLSLASGAFDAMFRILTAALEPGSSVAVEDPCFMTTLGLLDQLGHVALPLSLDAEGVEPDALDGALASGARAVILTPRAHNPTGASWSLGRREALRQVMDRHPATLLIEDDYFAPLSTVAAMSLAGGERPWAIVRSVSKFFGADFRLAFVDASPALHRRLSGQAAFSNRWVSGILQATVASLMGDPLVMDSLRDTRRLYAERRARLVAALAAHGVTVGGGDGINVWIPMPDELAATRRLLDRGWLVRPGAIMRIDAAPALRVTTSTLDAEQADRFAADLASVAEEAQFIRTA